MSPIAPFHGHEGRAPAAEEGYSVIVCTAGHRAPMLARCLAALSSDSSVPHEVLCVTRRPEAMPVGNGWTTLVLRDPGVSRAKKIGLARALYPYVLFTDDDCIPAPGWGPSLVRAMHETGAAGVTGPALRAREGRWPVEVAPRPQRILFRRHGPFLPPWELEGGVGGGLNMGFRRDMLMRLGGFDESLGPGSRFASAEDMDVFHRLLEAGETIVFEPTAVVHHEPLLTGVDAVRTVWRYRIGLGAFFAKHGKQPEVRTYFVTRFLPAQLRSMMRGVRRRHALDAAAYGAASLGALSGFLAYRLRAGRPRAA